MTVGWYLDADGVTHRLHVAQGWTDAVMPLDRVAGSWEGSDLGHVSTEAFALALGRALGSVDKASEAVVPATAIELHLEAGRLHVSGQGLSETSFAVPVQDAAPVSFTCLIEAEDARRLRDFGYPTMRLVLTAHDDWRLALRPLALSGAGAQPVVALRDGAPRTYTVRAETRMRAGALVGASALIEAVDALPDAPVDLVFGAEGLEVHSVKPDGGAWRVPAVHAGEPTTYRTSRASLSVVSKWVRKGSARIDMRLNDVDGEERLMLATYDDDPAPGWFMFRPRRSA